MSVPRFGKRIAGVTYRERPGAYGVVPGVDGAVAVIKVGGRYVLPGGGIDPGEAAEAALIREAREEVGLELRPERLIGCADEYLVAEATPFNKTGSFFVATLVRDLEGEGEATHELLWLEAHEALEKLSFGSQRWALARYLEIDQ